MFKADSGVLARQCGRLLAASLALLLVSCGGGSTPETLATSSSGSVASKSYGRISGFGSLIVNGVRFDDANIAKCTNCKTCYTDVPELFEKTKIVVDGSPKEVAHMIPGAVDKVKVTAELKAKVARVAANCDAEIVHGQ